MKKKRMKDRTMSVALVLSGLVVVAGVTSGVLAGGKGKPGGETPPPDPKIVYTQYGNFGTSDLILMNEDGSNAVELLSTSKVGHKEPNWGPNGYLSFVRCGDQEPDGIYWIKQDGSDFTFVEPGTCSPNFRSRNPAWSPDGRWIAYADLTETSFRDLFLIEVFWNNGVPSRGQTFRLTDTPDLSEMGPTWSPNSDRLVISVEINHDGSNYEIWVLDLKFDSQDSRSCLESNAGLPCIVDQKVIVGDGTEFSANYGLQSRLEPDWATAHDWILFRADTDGDGWRGIWIADIAQFPDIGYWKVIEDSSLNRWTPAWSPDDQYVTYGGAAGTGKKAKEGLYKLRLDLLHNGTTIQSLTPATNAGQLLLPTTFSSSAGDKMSDWKRTP